MAAATAADATSGGGCVEGWPPVRVLVDPSQPLASRALGAWNVAALGSLRETVGVLDPFDRSRFERGCVAACTAADDLAGEGGQAWAGLGDASALAPVHEYFRVRLARLPGPVEGRHTAAIISDVLEDVAVAPLAASDISAELAGMCAAIDRLVRSGQRSDFPASPVDAATSENALPIPPVVRALGAVTFRGEHERLLGRWVVAHQLHACFSVSAALVMDEVLADLRTGATSDATVGLAMATALIRGLSATRAHALCLPNDFYQEVVRPTMRPPAVPEALTGSMHVEFRMLRSRINEFLRLVSAPPTELARTEPELAAARTAFLSADLAEAERHVCLVDAAIGNARALSQSETSRSNALTVLRKLRDARARRIAPFLSFG